MGVEGVKNLCTQGNKGEGILYSLSWLAMASSTPVRVSLGCLWTAMGTIGVLSFSFTVSIVGLELSHGLCVWQGSLTSLYSIIIYIVKTGRHLRQGTLEHILVSNFLLCCKDENLGNDRNLSPLGFFSKAKFAVEGRVPLGGSDNIAAA